MEQQLEFDEWWTDYFSARHYQSGNEQLEDLKPIISRFSNDRQVAFIEELLNRDYVYFACEFISLYGNDPQKHSIRDKLLKWLDSNTNNSDGYHFIRVILKAYESTDYNMMKRYFSEQRTIWFNVPFELFHIDKRMFLSALEKWLPKFNDEKLYVYETLTYLINDLDAIEFLIDNLDEKESERIKKFCLAKSKYSYYSGEIKKALIRLSNK
jgi:hypothetical protein